MPSLDAYREQLRPFFGSNAAGIRFQVDGFQVDVIPYGPLVATGGVVEPAEGFTLDIMGMAEAAATAETVTLGSTAVRVPTLSSMIGLKLVAWHCRHGGNGGGARRAAGRSPRVDHRLLTDANRRLARREGATRRTTCRGSCVNRYCTHVARDGALMPQIASD